MSPDIDITPEQQQALLALLRRHLPDTEAWVYGSRVRGTARPSSDLDMVVFATPEQKPQVSNLREAYEESNLPFRVDLFVWDEVPDPFKQEIKRKHAALISKLENDRRPTSSPWRVLPFSKAITINPPVILKRGHTYPHVEMALLTPGTRSVRAITKRDYAGGGSRFEPGDTLMARITPCLENGKISRFDSSFPDDNGPAHGSTEFIVLRGRADVSDSEYVHYLAKSPDVRSFAVGQMTGTSGRQRVPTGCFEKLHVSIPPLAEQRAIAHILGTLDDKIELNRRMNETLEAMARAIFKDWFVDFGPTRAKAEGRAPYLAPELWELFPDALDDEGKPVGWTRAPLDEIAEFLNGLALQKFPASDTGGSLPVIKIAELRGGITAKTTRASRDIPHKYTVRDGDFLFSWSGSLLAKFWTNGDGALNQHLFKVTSDRFPSWFFSQWIHHHLKEFQAIAASKATTMGHIQRRHLREAIAICPPANVLELLGQWIGPIVELAVKNNLNSRTLAELRDLLLPKLMSGEIRIREAEASIETVI
ncbi:restriction endonuclease subunit S [Candidatus Foliamicus sp.]